MSKILLLASALFFALCTTANAQGVDAHEQVKKMARGVNILGYDDAFWKDQSKGRFKPQYFSMIKEAGFSTVRVNLHPFSHMDKNYVIDPNWLKTVDSVVEQGLKAKLMVILDLHEYNAMADNPVAKKEMFLSVWRQMGERYKHLPSDVLFEVLNEPNQALSTDLWNQFLAEAVTLIRSNNPHRTLIIGPGNWNGIESLDTLVLPKDDKNIVVTVHFYHPMNFTHQGAYWSKENKDISGVTWTATDAEKALINDKLAVAHAWSKKHNRPIFLGEFGAYDKGDMDSRVRYTSYVARTAESMGFSWAYWQFDSDFIVYDVENERWVKPIYDALLAK